MTDAAQSDSSADMPGEAERSYDLTISTSRSTILLVNRNRGVTLMGDRIAWTYAGADDAALFSSIRSVHLQASGSWQNPIAACRVTFADRYKLEVTDADSLGYPDSERHQLWLDFVHDLHARLSASGNTAIKYTTGFQGHRYPVTIALAILLGIITIIVPFFAMIAFASLSPLPALLGGCALLWPLYRMIEKNAPKTYDPDRPPARLLR